VQAFVLLVERKLQLLEVHPNLGRPTFQRKQVYKTLIHPRILLFYRVRPRLRQIELLSFWHTSRSQSL
jgi:plasmid stabilization system protein ParE